MMALAIFNPSMWNPKPETSTQSTCAAPQILLESVVEELHANDRDGSGDLSLGRTMGSFGLLGVVGVGVYGLGDEI